MEGSILIGFVLGIIMAVGVTLSLSVFAKPGSEIIAYAIYTFIIFFIMGWIFNLANMIIFTLIALIILVAFGNKLIIPLVEKIEQLEQFHKEKKQRIKRNQYRSMSLNELIQLQNKDKLDINELRSYLFEAPNDHYDEFGVNVDEIKRYKLYLQNPQKYAEYNEFHKLLTSEVEAILDEDIYNITYDRELSNNQQFKFSNIVNNKNSKQQHSKKQFRLLDELPREDIFN